MTFDQAAHDYDQDFSSHPIAVWLRVRIWQRLDILFGNKNTILELGCGTGEDACYLAQQGIDVIATDASAGMLRQTEQKADRAGLSIQTAHLDLNEPQTWALSTAIDGAYSNFGALNCTDNWEQLAAWLAQHMPSGAMLGLGVMGRFCLWETLWHGLHFDFKTAARRWRGMNTATLADGSHFTVYYPTPQAMIHAFAPHFEMRYLVGVGVFLPPSDSYGVVEKRPWLYRHLQSAESFFAHRQGWRGIGDHFWLELQRR